MAANLPLDGSWNFPNPLCLAPKHTGAELALRQPEKRIKDFGQSYRHFVTGLHYFCPTMQYIMYLLKKLKKEKKCIYFYVKSSIIIRGEAIFRLDPSIITQCR